MTTAHFDIAPRPHPVVARAATVARVAKGWLWTAARRTAEHYERRKAVRALMAFDDRALKDIGLHRGQIHNAVHGGGDRPRR